MKSNENSAATNVKRKTSVMRRIMRWSAWLVVQLVLAFVLLEIVARITDPLGISYYPETARHLDQVMIEEEPIGYRARPNYRGKHFGSNIAINSLGLRDREIPPEPNPNEFRILVMGDSVPYGIGVEYDESIPHQLELIANERIGSEQSYRTINMGIPSYNTEQELVQLESLGMQLQPDLVMLLFASNDIEPKMWVFDKRAWWVANLAQRSYAASLLFVLKRNAQMETQPTDIESAVPQNNLINWGAYDVNNPRWQVIDRSLTQINEICQDAGVPFVLFFTAEPGNHIRDMLDEVARREGFLVATLDRNADPDWRANPMKYQNSAVDAHPNVEGSRIYAERIYAALIDAGVLD